MGWPFATACDRRCDLPVINKPGCQRRQRDASLSLGARLQSVSSLGFCSGPEREQRLGDFLGLDPMRRVEVVALGERL
jgi:hypothetical protein